MEPVRYYIPTRGRVGKQTTLKNLPESVRRLTTIVCPQSEVSAHESEWSSLGVQVLAQPDEVRTIGEKRKWVFLSAATSVEFAWQLDDDLRFKPFHPELQRLVTCSKYPLQLEDNWTKFVNPLMGLYEAVGFGTSYFAPKGGIKENYHLGFAFGFSKRVRELIRYDLDVFEDISFTLDCLINGVRIAVDYDITVDQVKPSTSSREADGGVSGERNDSSIRKNFELLRDRFPGIVQEKELRIGAHPAAITKVSWRKAAERGGL